MTWHFLRCENISYILRPWLGGPGDTDEFKGCHKRYILGALCQFAHCILSAWCSVSHLIDTDYIHSRKPPLTFH